MNIESKIARAATAASTLEKPAQKRNPPQPINLEPGNYLFHPHEGVCVITGEYEMPAAGYTLPVLELRPLHDYKSTKLTPPLGKLRQLGIRAVDGVEPLARALKEFEKKPAAHSRELWSLQAEKYHEQLRKGDSVQNAVLIHKILSEYRASNFNAIDMAHGIPRISKLSYSAREIAQKAVDLLAGEISCVTGKTYRESQKFLLCCALVEGFVKGIKLDTQKQQRMSDAEFHAMFGMTLAEATTAKKSIVPIGQPKVHNPSTYVSRAMEGGGGEKHARFSGASVQGRVTKEKPAGKKERKKLPDRSKKTFEEQLSLDMRMVFSEEKPHLAQKGYMKACAMRATKILSPRDFNVYSKLTLRVRGHKSTIEDVAAMVGQSREEIIEIRNRCAEEMRKAINPSSKRGTYALFSPYAPPVEKKPRTQKMPKPPKAPRPPKLPKPTFAESLPEEMRGIFKEEQSYFLPKGFAKGIAIRAAQILKPEIFSVYSKLLLRAGSGKLSIADLAVQTGRSTEEIIATRNQAAEALRANMKPSGKLERYIFFNPYAPPVEKKPRTQKMPKPPKAPRPPKLPKPTFAERLPEEMRPIFEAELPYLAHKGWLKGLAIRAARILSPEEFDIYSKCTLRRGKNIFSFTALAEEKSVTTADIVSLRDSAAEKMRMEFNPIGRMAKYPHFHPYKVSSISKAPAMKKGATAFDRSPQNSDLLETYRQEEKMLVKKGARAELIHHAGKVLDQLEYLILLRTEYRKVKFRQSLSFLAKEAEVRPNSLGNMRNRGAEKLRQYLVEHAPALASHKSLQPCVAKNKQSKIKRQRPIKEKSLSAQPPSWLSQVRAENREIYQRENVNISQEKAIRDLLRIGAETLSRHEFDVLVMVRLRSKELRLTTEQYAAQKSMGREVVEMLHDGAIKKLGKTAPPEIIQVLNRDAITAGAAAPLDVIPPLNATDERIRKEKVDALFASESPHVSSNIVLSSLFEQARDILEHEEMLVLTRTDLRAVKLRETFAQVAAHLRIPAGTVVEIRNRAAAKLKERAVLEEGGFYDSPALRPVEI